MNPFIDGSQITLLRNGAEYFPALETAIENAEDEMEDTECTPEQRRNKARAAAIVDAGTFGGAMASGWVASLAGGPAVTAAYTAASAVGAIFASGTALLAGLADCGG